jgi:hypothetical protein
MKELNIVVGKLIDMQERINVNELDAAIYKRVDFQDSEGKVTRVNHLIVPPTFHSYGDHQSGFYIYKSEETGRSVLLASKENGRFIYDESFLESVRSFYYSLRIKIWGGTLFMCLFGVGFLIIPYIIYQTTKFRKICVDLNEKSRNKCFEEFGITQVKADTVI